MPFPFDDGVEADMGVAAQKLFLYVVPMQKGLILAIDYKIND